MIKDIKVTYNTNVEIPVAKLNNDELNYTIENIPEADRKNYRYSQYESIKINVFTQNELS